MDSVTIIKVFYKEAKYLQLSKAQTVKIFSIDLILVYMETEMSYKVFQLIVKYKL